MITKHVLQSARRGVLIAFSPLAAVSCAYAQTTFRRGRCGSSCRSSPAARRT